MPKLLKFVGLVLGILLGVIVLRTLFVPSKQVSGLTHTPVVVDS